MAIVRRRDLPAPRRGPVSRVPQARLHKTGNLYLSVSATQAFGKTEDFLVLVDYDDSTMILKFTVPEKLPRGITEEDLFLVRLKSGKRNTNPFGRIYARGLLRQIGYSSNGKSQEFPVASIDPVNHSISLLVPVEQACDGSSN